MNDGLFTPLNVSHALDVLGFNFQQDQYDAVHAARPKLPLMSSGTPRPSCCAVTTARATTSAT